MKIRIAIVIWGGPYVQRFLDVVLPSYLSPQNLPACVGHHDISVDIFTSETDIPALESSAPMRRLRELVEVGISSELDDFLRDSKANKWKLKGRAQSLAIRRAIKTGSVLFLMNPDSVTSDGTFSKTCELVQNGARVVNVLELARVERERAVPAFIEKFRSPDGTVLTVSPRDLVATALQHMHPIGKLYNLNRENICGWPSIAYWPCGDDSLLARAFHLHPQAIDLRHCNTDIPDHLMTDDGGLIEFLGFRKTDIHTVSNSDDFALCELSDLDIDPMAAQDRATRSKTFFVLKWANAACIPTHVDNYRTILFTFRGPHFEEILTNAIQQFDRETSVLRFLLGIQKGHKCLRSFLSRCIRGGLNILRIFRHVFIGAISKIWPSSISR